MNRPLAGRFFHAFMASGAVRVRPDHRKTQLKRLQFVLEEMAWQPFPPCIAEILARYPYRAAVFSSQERKFHAFNVLPCKHEALSMCAFTAEVGVSPVTVSRILKRLGLLGLLPWNRPSRCAAMKGSIPVASSTSTSRRSALRSRRSSPHRRSHRPEQQPRRDGNSSTFSPKSCAHRRLGSSLSSFHRGDGSCY